MKTIFKVFSADMIAKIVNMCTTILLIRVMNEHEYAEYTVIVAAANIFNQIAISSFGKFYIVDHKKLAGNESGLLVFEMILSVIVSCVFLIAQPSTRDNKVGLFLLLITTCIYGFARILYQQQCRFRGYSIMEIIRTFVFFAFSAFAYRIMNADLLASSVIIAQCVSLLISAPLLIKKYSRIIWKKDLNLVNIIRIVLQKEQIFIFIYAVLMAVLLQMDVLSLKTYSSDYSVSAYSSALKYYSMMLMLLSTVNSVLLPKISLEEDYNKIKKLYHQQDVLSFALLIGVVASIVIAPVILPILDGGKYPEAIRVFQILCISALISFWGSPYNNLLIKERKYRSLCIRFVIGIIVAWFGNRVIIPLLGINGTAIITLVSYGIVNISSRIEAKFIINRRIKDCNDNDYKKD